MFAIKAYWTTLTNVAVIKIIMSNCVFDGDSTRNQYKRLYTDQI